MTALNAMLDTDFDEALGYLLYDQGAVASPFDVDRAEVVRKPEVRADISNDGISEPAEEYIRFTRLGETEWRFHDLTGVSPEQLLWDMLRAGSNTRTRDRTGMRARARHGTRHGEVPATGRTPAPRWPTMGSVDTATTGGGE